MQVFVSLTFSGFISLKMRTKVKHIISRLGIAMMMFMEPFAVSGVISRIIWINLIRSLDTTLPRVDVLQNNLPTSSGFNPGTMFYHQTFNRNSWKMIQPGLFYNLFGLKGPSSRLENILSPTDNSNWKVDHPDIFCFIFHRQLLYIKVSLAS